MADGTIASPSGSGSPWEREADAFDTPTAFESRDQARRVALVVVGVRPLQLGGADRELMLLLILTVAILVFAVLTLWSVGFALLLLLTGRAALRRLGKADPLFRAVFLRQRRYADFYAPHAGLRSRPSWVPARWRLE